MYKQHECHNPDCNNLTSNSKFCSKTCAAIVNNKKFPKRSKHKKKYFCKVCGIKVPYRRTLCDEHNPQKRDWSKITLKDVVPPIGGGFNRYNRVRDAARRTYRNSDRPKKCEYCGYDKYYEICHMKPIHLFSLDTTISVINDISNLIALCPNCHWELDNGLLSGRATRI